MWKLFNAPWLNGLNDFCMNTFTLSSDFLSSLSQEAQQIYKAGEGVWESLQFSPGMEIFKEGEASHDLYFILKGEVEITKKIQRKALETQGENTQKLLAVLSAGGVFGEGALLSGKLRSASVRTLQETEVLVLTQEKFNTLIREKPSVAASLLWNLLKIVNQRLISTNQELVTLYHISQMLRDFQDDLPGLIKEVALRLQELTQASRGLVSVENQSDRVQAALANWGDLTVSVQELEQIERTIQGQHEMVMGNRFIVPIRNFEGKFWGLIVLESETPWHSDRRKLVRSVAEPLGIAIEDYHFVQLEAGRSKLGQRSIQF